MPQQNRKSQYARARNKPSRGGLSRDSTSRSTTAFSTPQPQTHARRFATRSSVSNAHGRSSVRSQSARSQSARSQSTTTDVRDFTTSYSHDGEAQHEDDEDALNEVIMAIEMRERGTIGCAYYVAATETLYFMDDIISGSKDIIETLRLQIRPTVILACTRADDDVLECLNAGSLNENADETSNNGLGLSYLLELRPRSEFDYDSATSKLIQLNIGAQGGPRVVFSVPGDVAGGDRLQGIHEDIEGSQAALMRLSGWIQMESKVTVGCAGAVISSIQRRRLARFLPGDLAAQAYYRLSIVEMFSLRGTMHINSDTLLSLQVLQSESHPHQHRQGPTGSGSKEGLSVFGLFAPLTRTPQGRRELKQYFLRPSLSHQVLCDRLNTVSAFTRPENSDSLQKMIKSMGGIKNIRTLLVRLRGGVSGGTGKSGGIAQSIWTGLRDFAHHVLSTLGHFQEMGEVQRLSIFIKMQMQCNTEELAAVGAIIERLVDFDESARQRRTCVRLGIDGDLDERKRFYDGLSDLLSEVARGVTKRVPGNLPTELNVIYFPQIGFLIAMHIDPDTGGVFWEGDEDDVWERMFSTEAVKYYKNDQMREMDERFGDLYGEICDREIELVHELAERVLQYQELLARVSDLCGELDCLLALAQAAERYRLVRPHISNNNDIQITGGRHILQELTVPAFVANNTSLEGHEDDTYNDPEAGRNNGNNNMLVITGPNYSGKSVYMKQVALIVYMAHIGSFVPAEEAKIGLTDKILTRISTRESVSRNQSAFQIDLNQICKALKLATRRSLLIIDELGKGTTGSDGAGLACATIEHLIRADVEMPKTLVATHFHEIFENGYIQAQPGLQFLHMEVRINDDASEVTDQVVYVYNLRKGRSVASYGTVCAAINGISSEIVHRAEQLVLMSSRGEDLVAACAIMSDEEAENLSVAENIARSFLASDLEGQPRRLLEELLDG